MNYITSCHLYIKKYNAGKNKDHFENLTVRNWNLCFNRELDTSCFRTLLWRRRASSFVQWSQTLQLPGVRSCYQETGSWLLMESAFLDWTTKSKKSIISHILRIWHEQLCFHIFPSFSGRELIQSSGARLRLLVSRSDWMAKIIQNECWRYICWETCDTPSALKDDSESFWNFQVKGYGQFKETLQSSIRF